MAQWQRICLEHMSFPTVSPASSRKSAPSPSRSSSPSGSPKTGSGGRRPGRLRLPQLGSRQRLSNSRENLDGASNPEAESRADTEGSAASGPPGSGGALASEASCGSEASSSHCDVVLMNGDSNGLNSDCSTEGSMDPDNPLLPHGDICLDAVYNLYAISVGATLSDNELLSALKQVSHISASCRQCHSGIMGGGHYVTYAKNPNEKWYCYNDSSCKVRHEVTLYSLSNMKSILSNGQLSEVKAPLW